jgi:hypothetical protein
MVEWGSTVLKLALPSPRPERQPSQFSESKISNWSVRVVVSEMSVLSPVRIERASVVSEADLAIDARPAMKFICGYQ